MPVGSHVFVSVCPSLLESLRACFARCRHDKLQRLVSAAGALPEKSRWFASFDSAAAVEESRNCMRFLVDLALSLQRMPVRPGPASFSLSMDAVFKQEGEHSLRVAARLLQDDRLASVPRDDRGNRTSASGRGGLGWTSTPPTRGPGLRPFGPPS